MRNRSRQNNKRTYNFREDNHAETGFSMRERLEFRRRKQRNRMAGISIIIITLIIIGGLIYLLINSEIGFHPLNFIKDTLTVSSSGNKINTPLNESDLYDYLRPIEGEEFFDINENSTPGSAAENSVDNALEQTNRRQKEADKAAAASKGETANPDNKTSESMEGAAESGKMTESMEETAESTVTKGEYKYVVKQSKAVDNSYFSDAVFIGDSRTEGLFINTGLTNAEFYVHKGLSIDKVSTQKIVESGNRKISVLKALKKNKFNKVYIMFGVNELGWPYGTVFKDKFKEVIVDIKKLQPGAFIYVQEILPVTEEKDRTSEIYTNKKIKKFNKIIREIVQEEQIYYLAVGDAVKNQRGALPENASTDGVHLTKPYYIKWLDYLKNHVVTE